MAIEEAVEVLTDILPNEILSKIDFLIVIIQTLGGLIIIYLILILVKFLMIRNQNKILQEIKKDIRIIKNRIKK